MKFSTQVFDEFSFRFALVRERVTRCVLPSESVALPGTGDTWILKTDARGCTRTHTTQGSAAKMETLNVQIVRNPLSPGPILSIFSSMQDDTCMIYTCVRV